MVMRNTGTSAAIRSNSSRGRVAVGLDVGAGAGGDRQVPAQDGWPLLDRHLLQAHLLVPTVAQHRPAVGGPDVAHPVRLLAQHRHEVAVAVHLGDHHGERDDAPAAPAPHLELRHAARPDPLGEDDGGHAVLQLGEAARAATPVEPP
jgi:hypothetical protein